ncbi:unnamed protein product [Colletotrichum noveboracense]|uniref:Uncharacterized protein n=1 Tax=Colletotrichum noveboracense TaxID=2664923 RepID=A0A9W4WCN1_9PEZI|nr:unnamed protein product [Colletotrichum noveboracense]
MRRAALTILAACWGRVEFQAMRYTPWISLSMAKTSVEESTYVLDYPSMSTPTVLIQSFRRKHRLVFLSSVASLVLKIQIALAPGLFTLTDVSFNKAVKVNVLDSFDVNTSFSDAYSTHLFEDASPYYIPQAIEDFGMEFPFGVSNKPPVAYQTFELQDVDFDSSTREIDWSMSVSVDGLFADLQCRKMENYSVLSVIEENPLDDLRAFKYDVDLRFQGCDESSQTTARQKFSPPDKRKPYIWILETQGVSNVSCSDLPQQVKQFMYFAALLKASPNNSSLMEVSTAAAIICSAVAWIEKVTVVHNANITSVTKLTDQIKTPVAADIWQLMLVSFTPDSPFRGGLDGISGPIAIDGYKGKFVEPIDPSTYNNDAMLESTLKVFQNMSPFIGHYRLRKHQKHGIAGLVILTSQMITVNHQVGISMTILFAITTCAIFYMVFRGSLGTPMTTWHRDPATILGSIAFLHENPGILKEFPIHRRYQHQTCWGDSEFSPFALRIWARAAFTFFILGIIVALGCIQQLSAASDGFITISAHGLDYAYLLWTSVPALMMLVISIYTSSCNTTWKSISIDHFWMS